MGRSQIFTWSDNRIFRAKLLRFLREQRRSASDTGRHFQDKAISIGIALKMQILSQFQRAQMDPTLNHEKRTGNSPVNDGKHRIITFSRTEGGGLWTKSSTFCAIRKEGKIGRAHSHCQPNKAQRDDRLRGKELHVQPQPRILRLIWEITQTPLIYFSIHRKWLFKCRPLP